VRRDDILDIRTSSCAGRASVLNDANRWEFKQKLPLLVSNHTHDMTIARIVHSQRTATRVPPHSKPIKTLGFRKEENTSEISYCLGPGCSWRLDRCSVSDSPPLVTSSVLAGWIVGSSHRA